MKIIKLIIFISVFGSWLTARLPETDQLFINAVFNNKFAEFPINVVAADPAKQLYQVDVLSQWGPGGTCSNDPIYGSTCGRHAFKNALFTLLALQSYQDQNELEFINYAQNLKDLTPETNCILHEINNASIQYRHDFNIEVIAGVAQGEQTLSAEEVKYLIDKMPEITHNCGIPFYGLEIITAPFFPGINFKDILKGDSWGKPIINAIEKIRINADYNVAFIVSVGGHWITLIAYKNAGILKFITMDSSNNANRLNDANINTLVELITNPDSFDVNRIKQKFDFEEISDKLFQLSIQYRNYQTALQEAVTNNDQFRIIDLELDLIPDLTNEILALNSDIKNVDGFNPFADRESLSNLLPLFPQAFQEQVARDKIAYTRIKAARKLLENLKSGDLKLEKLITELKFPAQRDLKIFKEASDPLEYSYEGLIEKYNTNIITNPNIARKLLTYLYEIAYIKEGYANQYAFIRQYLMDNGFSQKAIEEKLAPEKRNLKIYKEINDPLSYSYEGMIEEYFNALGQDLVAAKKILTDIQEIAYTKEGYANEYAFIRQYLEDKGFSKEKIIEKLR